VDGPLAERKLGERAMFHPDTFQKHAAERPISAVPRSASTARRLEKRARVKLRPDRGAGRGAAIGELRRDVGSVT
jgi:hypothetical protein